MSVLLPFVLDYNLDARRQPLGELLLPLAGPDIYAATPPARRPEAAITRIRDLRDRLHGIAGLPRRLSETGKVPRERLPEIARLALDDGSLIMNPVEVGYAEALAVLERAF
jgi:alcohol dehydrogenase